ncbi:MAG: SWIM zinc finger family protein [Chloroflexi bacterium]|nr:SWIM zinc finger family protein [Chloroflexota bacterium]
MAKLTVQQVRQRAGDQNFARGQNYYYDDAIYNTVQRGNQIEALCQGSADEPYRVKAVIDDSGIASTSCTCPYDYGGDCKHIVALLLTYVSNPEKFTQVPKVKDVLRERSRDELIVLIQRMVERHPDLEPLLEMPLPRKKQAKTPINVDTFRQQIHKVLKRAPRGWNDSGLFDTMQSIINSAESFSKAGDWRSASSIYSVVLEEVIAETNAFFMHDDDGQLYEALDEVISALYECLEHLAADAQQRPYLFKTLLAVCLWDNTEGRGADLAVDAPEMILRLVQPEDIPALRAQVLAAKPALQRLYGNSWDFYAEFLADLDMLDHVDPDIVLQRLREDERYEILFEKLLAFGRADEAVTVLEEHIDGTYERMRLLPALVAAGREDDALRLGRATILKRYDDEMMAWLIERYQARGDLNTVFELQQQRMDRNPSSLNYQGLKAAASTLGQWDAVRSQIINKLTQAQNFNMLARIYLIDEQWDLAWSTLEQVDPKQSTWYAGPALDLEVAEASRHARPEKAIPVYLKHAEAQIAVRKREHYQMAASYLAIVRDLYKQTGETAAWKKVIARFRDEYRRLPALQEELDRAKV